MTRQLKCVCGNEVQVPETETNDLIWCPRCRNTLSAPRAYKGVASRSFRSSRSAPASSGGGTSYRWVVGIAGVAIFALIRICIGFNLSSSTSNPNRYAPPNRAPTPTWQEQRWRQQEAQDDEIERMRMQDNHGNRRGEPAPWLPPQPGKSSGPRQP